MNNTPKRYGVTRQLSQFLIVDIIYLIATGSQSDIQIFLIVNNRLAKTGVEQLQVMGCGSIVADMVEHSHKHGVTLPIDMGQFYCHQLYLTEHMSREEVGIGIETVDDVALVGFHHRFQLEGIAYQQQLLAAKWLTQVVGIDTQDTIDSIDNVCAHHRNLIDDDKFQLFEQLAVRLAVFEKFMDAPSLQ